MLPCFLSLLSATHVSLPEIDDGAVEIRRAPHLHRHVLAAAAAVRKGEREVIRGARARREGCRRERGTLLDGFESQGTKKAILDDRNVPIYKVFPGYFPRKTSDHGCDYFTTDAAKCCIFQSSTHSTASRATIGVGIINRRERVVRAMPPLNAFLNVARYPQSHSP